MNLIIRRRRLPRRTSFVYPSQHLYRHLSSSNNLRLRIDGHSMTLHDLVAASSSSSSSSSNTQIYVPEANWTRIRECRDVTDRFASGKKVVYGINTSCGSLVDQLLPKHALDEFQINLIRAVATQAGEPFENHIVRGAMIARINSLARGYSGIAAKNLETLIAMVNHDITPIVPRVGSLGASGDLGPLACIALTCIGEWEVMYQGRRQPALEALQHAGIPPMKLSAKEGLSLINGTSCMVSLGAHVVTSAINTMKTADVLCALSLQALRAHDGPFDIRVHDLKFHLGQRATAWNLNRLLNGSQLMIDDVQFSTRLAELFASTDGVKQLDVPIEDGYSLRCHPQMKGPAHELVENAFHTLTRELNSSNDNPLILPKQEHFMHNGNFHGQAVSVAMDCVNMALNLVGILSDRRVDRMLDVDHSSGLPPELIPHHYEGIRMGLMGIEFLSTSAVAENRTLALPASIQSIPSTSAFQDVVSFGLIGGRKTAQVLANVQRIMAAEALCAAEAINLRHGGADSLSPATKEVHRLIRSVVPFNDTRSDRVYMTELEQLVTLIDNGSLLAAAERVVGPLHLTHDRPDKQFTTPPPIPTTNANTPLYVALKRLQQTYAAKFETSGRVFRERLETVMPAGNTKSLCFVEPYPPVIKSGQGAVVTTEDGHDLVDFVMGYGTILHGHCHPTIEQRVIDTVKRGTLFSLPVMEQGELAQALCERVPSMEQVRFANSGTEAVMFAVRAARVFTGRDKILMFGGGYHGSHDQVAVSSVRVSDAVVTLAGIPPQPNTIMAPYNDVDATRRLIMSHGHELACVLFEPMLGANGLLPATDDFLAMLRELTHQHNILLVADECLTLQCAYHGMCASRKIVPDLTVFGKFVGGGYPIGGFGGRKDVMAVMDPRSHDDDDDDAKPYMHQSGSFNGHSVALAAGCEALRLYNHEQVDELAATAASIATRMREIVARVGGVHVLVQQYGRFITLHFNNTKTNEAVLLEDLTHVDAKYTIFMYMHMLTHHNVLTTPRQFYSISPSHTQEQQLLLLTAFEHALTDLKVLSA